MSLGYSAGTAGFAGEHDGFGFLRCFWLLLLWLFLLWLGGFWRLPDGKTYTHFLAAGFRRQQVQKFWDIAQHGLETAVAEVAAGDVVVCQKLGDVVDGMDAVIDLFTEKAVELLFLFACYHRSSFHIINVLRAG